MNSKLAKMSLNEKNKFVQVTLSRFESHHGEGAVPAEEDTWTNHGVRAQESPVSVGNSVCFDETKPSYPQRHKHTNFTTKVVRVHSCWQHLMWFQSKTVT